MICNQYATYELLALLDRYQRILVLHGGSFDERKIKYVVIVQIILYSIGYGKNIDMLDWGNRSQVM